MTGERGRLSPARGRLERELEELSDGIEAVPNPEDTEETPNAASVRRSDG